MLRLRADGYTLSRVFTVHNVIYTVYLTFTIISHIVRTNIFFTFYIDRQQHGFTHTHTRFPQNNVINVLPANRHSLAGRTTTASRSKNIHSLIIYTLARCYTIQSQQFGTPRSRESTLFFRVCTTAPCSSRSRAPGSHPPKHCDSATTAGGIFFSLSSGVAACACGNRRDVSQLRSINSYARVLSTCVCVRV